MTTRFRFSSIPITLAILALAALTTGCGVSKSKHTAMTKERDDAIAKSAQLQTSLDAVTKDKAQLEADKAALDSKVKEMEATVAQQQKVVDDAKAQYESMIGQMKSELSNGKIEIEQMRDGINVNLAQDILFKSGSANLDKAGKEILTKVAEELKSGDSEIAIIGHADNLKIGPVLAQKYPTNWELGSARASQITRLFQEAGVPAERMYAVSAADGRPRADNSTEEGRAQNRRIEIRLRPTRVDEPAASN